MFSFNDCSFIIQFKCKQYINSWLHFHMFLWLAILACVFFASKLDIFSTLVLCSFFSDNVVFYGAILYGSCSACIDLEVRRSEIKVMRLWKLSLTWLLWLLCCCCLRGTARRITTSVSSSHRDLMCTLLLCRVPSDIDGGEWYDADVCQAIVPANAPVEAGRRSEQYRAAVDRLCHLRAGWGNHTSIHQQHRQLPLYVISNSCNIKLLQCFDAVGWAAGRASSL